MCKVGFKQNIVHLGKEIVACGVHGHCRIMSMEWPTVWTGSWDRLTDEIHSHGIQFMAGDFNMSVAEVTQQLRSRGIKPDFVAWCPWPHLSKLVHDQLFGFDSCAIFFLGSYVEISMPWSWSEIALLTTVADDMGR